MGGDWFNCEMEDYFIVDELKYIVREGKRWYSYNKWQEYFKQSEIYLALDHFEVVFF